MSLLRSCLLVALAALAVLAAVPAAHAESVVTLRGFDSPAPAQYDKVKVLKQGPSSAKNVLVLAPGTSAGGAYFRPIAADIVRRLPGWQIWSVERRENLLEDHSRLDRALSRGITLREAFDYYLGWLADSSITTHFQPVADSAVPWARQWGMRVAVEDLRRVVSSARKGGRRVVLGGHSLGGSIATAYATWDFGGRAGAADLSGLVLIDGGSGGGTPPTEAAAGQSLAQLSTTSPFLDLVGLGLPWAAGIFAAAGSSAAVLEPSSPSFAYTFPLLPATLKPPVPVTNAAQWGYAVDTQTGPASLALVQMHLGQLAATGDPRGWVDGELVTVRRSASLFAGIPGMDGSSWYHPRRLSIDSQAVNGGVRNPAQGVLDVQAVNGRKLDFPIYAIETSLGKGRVLKAARTLARQSGVRGADLKLVDRSTTYAHIDPLAAEPSRNDFLKTLLPFLRRID